MDIREVLSTLENLNDKKDKIAKARTKLEEKQLLERRRFHLIILILFLRIMLLP